MQRRGDFLQTQVSPGGRGIKEGGDVDIFKNKVLSHPQLHSEFKTSLVWMRHQPPPKMAGALGTSEEKLAPGDLQLQGNSGTQSEVCSRPGLGQCSLVVHVSSFLFKPTLTSRWQRWTGRRSLDLFVPHPCVALNKSPLSPSYQKKNKEKEKELPTNSWAEFLFIFFWKILFNKHVLLCLR